MQGHRAYKKKDSKKHTFFQIKIHDPFSVADMSTSVNVKAGYETTFVITPLQIVASNDVKDMASERRNCLFGDETGKLHLFKYYLVKSLVKSLAQIFCSRGSPVELLLDVL